MVSEAVERATVVAYSMNTLHTFNFEEVNHGSTVSLKERKKILKNKKGSENFTESDKSSSDIGIVIGE